MISGNRTLAGLLLFGVVSLSFSHAQTVKDREGAIRKDAREMENDDRWIYNDVDAGFAEARRTGKPLLCVLRCVPCLACMGIDAEVLMGNPEITPLLERFVLVRIINANDLDLSLFQFDYDLSFSVLFFHPDRTPYGRFGSWEHQKDSGNRVTDGFRVAMERVLSLHENYERYADALAGKRGEPMRWRTPVDMPQLSGKYRPELDWNGQVVKSCVHCHQIGDARRLELRDQGKTLPLSLIAPYPAPETIGITMDEEDVMRVAVVDDRGPAGAGGLLPGDELLTLAGQPLVSVADISWVLHHADADGELEASASRDGETKRFTLSLEPGWRKNSDLSRRVGSWPMRAMAFGGMKLEELDETGRRRVGLPEDALALEAIHVGRFNKHAAARRAGFREGDILVEVDGDDTRVTESELLIRNLMRHVPGERLSAVVLRNGKRIPLQMPIQ